MFGHSHHDHQKRDLQVSKRGGSFTQGDWKQAKEGSSGGGGLASRAIFMKVLYVYVSLHMCACV